MPNTRIQTVWAAILRSATPQYAAEIEGVDERTLRFRPGPGEWSATEILGHMADTMEVWTVRVRLVVTQDDPFLPGYDQDAYVRDRQYQDRPRAGLLALMAARCEEFAIFLENLPDTALSRTAVHGENGAMTLRQCVDVPLATIPDHLLQLKQALMNGETD